MGQPVHADMRNMTTIHVMFRREFGLMPELVQSVTDAERVKVVTGHIQFMNHLLHHHHQAEDAVLWPLLRERAPEEIEPVVRLVEGHHQQINTLLDQAGQRLDAWAGNAGPAGAEGAGPGEQLSVALRQLAVVLFEHMNLEEQLVMPVVARHVFTDEWVDMEDKSVTSSKPEDFPLLFGMALYEGGEEIVPEPLRADVVPVAPGFYADYAERVYGTRTPPSASDLVVGTPSVGVTAR